MNRLYYYLSFSLLGIFLSHISVNASEQDDDFYSERTPSPVSEVLAIVEQTPGQCARSMQREFLKEENFTAVLSEEGKRKLVELGIDWGVFTDSDREYDDPEIRICIRRIKIFLRNEKSSRKSYNDFYGTFLRVEDASKAVSQSRIEDITTAYFSERFPDFSIRLTPKGDGVQMGTIVILRSIDKGDEMRFYVKTHALGLLSEKSTAAKPFDPAEFVAYRILQGFGLGCETHLFGRDQREFYIATLDAGTGGYFQEYAKIKRSNEGMLRLCGVLSGYLSLGTPTEEVISQDAVAQNYMRHIVSLDLLARMLRLGDLQSNGNNFGFFASEANGLMQLRIIDFRLLEDKQRDYTWDHWGGFLEGNGLFVPSGVDYVMRFTLREREQKLRVEEAHRLFDGAFANYESVCDEAFISVCDDLVGDRYIKDREDAVTYANTVKDNFRIFKQFCRLYVNV